MTRPFINHSVDQLEAEYDRASSAGDVATLQRLSHELTHRKTPRARELQFAVDEALSGITGTTTPFPPPPRPLQSTPKQKQTTKHQKRIQNPSKHKPTPEQSQAIEAFLSGGALKINAYAGTGKTSTLEMLAHATDLKGQYIAFNRAIVADARDKFPNTVNCSTTHGLAFRATPSEYRNSSEKMTGKVNAHKLAELLGLKKNWRIDKDHTLQPVSQAALILKTLQRYTQSADPEPIPEHVPRHGSLLTASDATIKAVEDFAVRGARHVWQRMTDASDQLPLGHDGYLKLWALSDPTIAADFILLDEAQDTNPVVLDVLRKQSAQMVFVGDKYQQIYEWRGAVNAMEKIDTDATTLLTKSFRFGEAIADAASKVLALLGEKVPIVGNSTIDSRIGPTNPRTVLARTNATTITAIIDTLDIGLQPHLVGGNAELMEMLRGVQDLKRGKPSTVQDFFGFQNWKEVVDFAKSGEGEHLLTFVNLVESRGEKQLMWALDRTVDEDGCDIIISTAHKAKGREWSKVRLMDDFLKSQPGRREESDKHAKTNGHDPAELRLFYVAMTRAREEMEIASTVMPLIGMKAPAHMPPPLTLRPSTTSKQSGGKPNPPTAKPPPQRVAWTPPRNWEPDLPPDRPTRTEPLTPQRPLNRPARQDTSQPPKKKKGILGWLFGN